METTTMTVQNRWLEIGEPTDNDRVEATIRTIYQTGPTDSAREDDIEAGTLDIEALELLDEDEEIEQHVHDDGSVLLSALPADAEDRLLESFRGYVPVEYEGDIREVPLKYERADIAAWFGDVPETWDVDRIFLWEDSLRTEAIVAGEWVETVLHTDNTHPTYNAQNDRGWIADVPREADPDEGDIGETIWKRPE